MTGGIIPILGVKHLPLNIYEKPKDYYIPKCFALTGLLLGKNSGARN
ncbi:hypothetical protein [[Phormidium] sp. ETS-05]|nr:hypothetical protein [[Phormidium] sp. ETS-05]